MSGPERLLWVVLAHLMDLSVLAAWTAFAWAVLRPGPSPLGPAILAFVAAYLMTRATTGRGWRVVAVLLPHAAGLLSAAAAILHTVYAPTAPFLDRAWLLALVGAERTAVEWTALLATLLAAGLFWRGGVTLAWRPESHAAACGGFDAGVASFATLYLIKWMAAVNGGVVDDPVSHRFLFSFFAASLLAIGLSRLSGSGARRFLPGRRGVGVFLAFATATLSTAAALVLFCLPALTLAARAGLVALQWAAATASPFLLMILRFLFAPHSLRADPPAAGRAPRLREPLPVESPGGTWVDLLGHFLGWLMMAALVLAGLALLCLAAYALWRFLLSRTAAASGRETGGEALLRPLLAWLRRILARAAAGGHSPGTAREFFAGLLGWARRSGHARAPAETPAEFGGRLTGTFPRLGPEIAGIVEACQREVYGAVPLAGERAAALALAWRRLRSPRHWPTRTREWLRREEPDSPPGRKFSGISPAEPQRRRAPGCSE